MVAADFQEAISVDAINSGLRIQAMVAGGQEEGGELEEEKKSPSKIMQPSEPVKQPGQQPASHHGPKTISPFPSVNKAGTMSMK